LSGLPDKARVQPGGLGTAYAPPLDLPFRFMATALAWLALMTLVYPWHTPLLLGSFYHPHLTTFVHVNTLGLIAATIFGASYQLLPVVLQVPIASVRLARLSWWLYLPGTVAFVVGLSQGWRLVLAAGGTLLFAAIALYVGVVVATLRRSRERDAVYWHIALSVAGLAVAATLGLLLAFSKHLYFLGDATLRVLAAHAVLMVGGWVTPLLTGVAYRLVGMFTLSEDHIRPEWAWTELLLTAGGAWIMAASLLLGGGRIATSAGAAALLGGVGLFACHLWRLYRHRRRRSFDVHIPFAVTATGFGLAAGALVLYGSLTGRAAADPIWMAAGWLAIAGWIQTSMQGFLYKIGTFLTWLHRYAPVVGRQRVPKLEDLYGRRTALAGWACWTVGVAAGGVAALGVIPWLAYVAAGGLSAGAGAFLINAGRVGRHLGMNGRSRSPNTKTVQPDGWAAKGVTTHA
jgi:hypothetical protein